MVLSRYPTSPKTGAASAHFWIVTISVVFTLPAYFLYFRA
jgi:hypothetical protein